jgi:hypothetical protein
MNNNKTDRKLSVIFLIRDLDPQNTIPKVYIKIRGKASTGPRIVKTPNIDKNKLKQNTIEKV